MTHIKGSLSARYSSMVPDRECYLDRAEDVSSLTLPDLFPPDGDVNQELPTPYQSLGARGVSNLSAKLLLALFPPAQSTFRLSPAEGLVAQAEADGEDRRTELEEALGLMERAGHRELEAKAYRPKIHEALKQLIVGGNSLVHVGEQKMKVHKLSNYVCKRDPAGTLLLAVVREQVGRASLTASQQALLTPEATESQVTTGKDDVRSEWIDLWTGIERQNAKKGEVAIYKTWQELGDSGQEVPESQGSFPEEKLPWLALRMVPVDGASYGYGYGNALLGDLKSLEGLTESVVEAAAAAAKLLMLVNPNGSTRLDDVASAENGAVRHGVETDVTTVGIGNKAADMRIAFEAIKEIIQRLSQAFLLNSSVQRQGERVTAEEIRFLASELESVLAGVYSLLSAELQLPLIKLILDELTERGDIPPLPEGQVQPVVVAGLDALGRGADAQRLDLFIQGALQTFGPEILAQYIDVTDYLTRRATAFGLDKGGLVKTAEQVAEAQQRAQLAAGVNTLGPSAITAAGKVAAQQ